MKVLIIEDEMPTALRLKELLLQYDPAIEVAGILTSVSSSIRWFSRNAHPDLIFQDIELSDGLCFEIFQETRVDVPVIFTTAYSTYALRAFEVNSIDYVVKPYDISDIQRVLDKFARFKQVFQPPMAEMLQNILQPDRPIRKKRFLVRLGDSFKSFKSDEVAYILSEDGLSFIYTFEGKRFPIDQSLSELSETLDQQEFFRVNRHCIVNHQGIEKISSWFNSRLKLALQPKTNESVIVSRKRAKAFKAWLGN